MIKQQREYKGFKLIARRRHGEHATVTVVGRDNTVAFAGQNYWTCGDALETGRCKIDAITGTPQEPWPVKELPESDH